MTQHRNSAEIVKSELARIFNDSIELRALYLLNRENHGSRTPFSSEDLAQFLILLLVHNFRGAAGIPAIPEFVIQFLIGDVDGTKNAIAATLRANFFDNKDISAKVDWDTFYYLHLLPKKKLFHLTSAREKIYAASLFAKIVAENPGVPRAFLATNLPIDIPPSEFGDQNDDSNSSFISMQNISLETTRAYSVTICGFHRAMMGLGEDARRMFDVLTELGFRVELFDCSPSSLEIDPTLSFYEMFETRVPCSEVVIFCMPVFEMARILPRLSKQFFSTRYIVGYWPWELTSFPVGWTEIMDIADEIWASSKFLLEVYRTTSKRPVHYVPLCVEIVENADNAEVSDLFQSGHTTFITIFDFNSSINRKNPIGSIRAFKAAFADGRYDARLILKGIHGHLNDKHLQHVIAEIGGDPRITLIDGPISRLSLNGYISASSALLSLHRSEGFGRLLAEAMILRTPVIATDWSGSSDFVNAQTAFPIDFQLRGVTSSEYPYASGLWAEPNLDHAARIMRFVAEDASNCSSVVEKAYEFVTSNFSAMAIKSIILERMTNINGILSERKSAQ